jgi:hypothetical protein
VDRDLLDFVEAPGRFLDATPATTVIGTPRFVVVADADGQWASVEGIRLGDDEAAAAVAEVRRLLEPLQSRLTTWRLSDRSTPAGVYAQLVAAGLRPVAHDPELDGFLATSPPPDGPPEIEVRRIEGLEEWVAARQLQQGVFQRGPERNSTREQLAVDHERSDSVLFGAWLDGELVAAAAAVPTRRGLLLWGGATKPEARGRGCYRALVRARWDEAVRRGTPAITVHANEQSGPILRRLGFERVIGLRRLEDVRSWA